MSTRDPRTPQVAPRTAQATISLAGLLYKLQEAERGAGLGCTSGEGNGGICYEIFARLAKLLGALDSQAKSSRCPLGPRTEMPCHRELPSRIPMAAAQRASPRTTRRQTAEATVEKGIRACPLPHGVRRPCL